MSLLSPSDLGAPPQFSSWRPGQSEAFLSALSSDSQFTVLALPTGIGKSLLYMSLGLALDVPVVILTATKGLQDQLLRDFHSLGVRDVRGMGNYPCRALIRAGLPYATCDMGGCLDGAFCSLRDGGCDYYDALHAAAGARLVVTNYAFWLTKGRELLNPGLLVLDEAHEAYNELVNHVGVDLGEAGVVNLPRNASSLDWFGWQVWAGIQSASVEARLASNPAPGPTRRKLKRALEDLERLSKATGDWVFEETREGWHFEPHNPSQYASQLWGYGRMPERIILTSATIRPHALRYLGLEQGSYDFIECDSPFPVANRPIIHIPTVALSSKSEESDLVFWRYRIDQLLSDRLDRKGIIHTVSYDRARYLQTHSQFKEHFYLHDRATSKKIIADFKAASPPAILVSPSVTTGYDFPMDQCRYQIIAKIGFPDTRSAVMKARKKLDPLYASALAMVDLAQACGRGVRTMEDRCETLIVDDQVLAPWFWVKNRGLAPKFFLESFRTWKGPGLPPPLLLATT